METAEKNKIGNPIDNGNFDSYLMSMGERDYEKQTKIEGTITHINRASETWSAGRLQEKNVYLDRDVSFSVTSSVALGEKVVMHGAWVKDAKWGWQFKAKLIEYPMPDIDSSDGIAEYLTNNPAFKGIGPVKSKLIAEAFSSNFDQIIREDPERVAKVGKITIEQAYAVQAEWVLKSDTNAISIWLSSFGLTHCQIKSIAEKYGNQAKQILEADPYILCGELRGFGFARTDEIAMKMRIPKEHPGRIRACLVYLLENEADTGGHCWISKKELIRNAVSTLALDSLAAYSQVENGITELCGSDTFTEEIKGSGSLIALTKIYNRETDLIKWFAEGRANINATGHKTELSKNPEELINDAASATGKTPTESQRQAVKMVLENGISVITGGAGTGKSFTIALACKVFQNEELSIGMCAPTGKAAKRMSSLAEGAPAMTIHRLLGYNPQTGWTYTAENKLPYNFIVVDEVSMCDINLLWHLFSAIDWAETQVLLVGDHNQLPPIGAGNVLRDILDRELIPSHYLTECHRAAGELKINCNAILDGIVKPTTEVLAGGGREWRVIRELEDPDILVDSLRSLMNGKFEQWGFDPVLECQIITPYNKGKLGVNRLNAELQRVWQKRKYGLDLPEVIKDKEPHTVFLKGDKIMQIKNDYKLDVMNGTQGVIESIDKQQTPDGHVTVMKIKFEDRDELTQIEMGTTQANNIVLAYACSIHKVQGSEYACVVCIIHRQHTYMLSRNLMYTAVTRARKTAIVLGDIQGIRKAIRTTTPIERRTWMSLASCGGH